MLISIGVFVGSSSFLNLPEWAFQFAEFKGQGGWVEYLGEIFLIFRGVFGLFIDDKPWGGYRYLIVKQNEILFDYLFIVSLRSLSYAGVFESGVFHLD